MSTRIAAAAVLTVAVLALPVAADAKVTRLTLTEVVTQETLVVDSPPMLSEASPAPSAGDVFAGRAKLLRGTKEVGSADFFGVVTAFPRIEFFGTFTLPGGTVSVVALGSLTAPTQTYPIVGGTGRYEGARGTDKETRLAEGRTRDVFTIVT